jgi:hypothetical protein
MMGRSFRGARRILGVLGLSGVLVCGCPPTVPPVVPGPGGEVLANHLAHGSVRCGERTGGSAVPLGQDMASAPVLIRHQHKMGASFRLQSLRYVLSGVSICRLELARSREMETGSRALTLFRGRLPEGGYVIRQRARYRGHGFGVFAYLKGYRFRVAGGGRFTVKANTPLCVDVYSVERRASSLKGRPQVRLRIQPNCPALGQGITIRRPGLGKGAIL